MHVSPQALRRSIAAGQVSPEEFRSWLAALPEAAWDSALDELLELDPFVPDASELPAGCVPYLAAPVRSLLRLTDVVALDDSKTFVDVGCGVGRAAMMVHLLSGATALGVDIQAHLVALGAAVTQRLSLSRVMFTCGDACDPGALPMGDVYFMYCPFDAERVRRVLAILDERARARRIVVGCLQLRLPDCEWFEPVPSGCAELCVYRSRRWVAGATDAPGASVHGHWEE